MWQTSAPMQNAMQKGLQESLRRGLLEAVERLLVRRFGPLSKPAAGRLAAIRSAEELARLGERAVAAGSLAELGLG